MLLLYTDGIEESKRVFRKADGTEAACDFGGLPEGTEHGAHTVGARSEMFGSKRIADIINAVMNRGHYTLRKPHDPQENYLFDYSGCEGTADEAVMAAVSAEKLFRMFKAPANAENCRVPVDARIDAFLRGSLAKYERFIKDTSAGDTSAGTVYYEGMCEDEQYDDIAILGVMRK
jgi:hypothetical protein